MGKSTRTLHLGSPQLADVPCHPLNNTPAAEKVALNVSYYSIILRSLFLSLQNELLGHAFLQGPSQLWNLKTTCFLTTVVYTIAWSWTKLNLLPLSQLACVNTACWAPSLLLLRSGAGTWKKNKLVSLVRCSVGAWDRSGRQPWVYLEGELIV